LPGKPKIVCVGRSRQIADRLLGDAAGSYEVVLVETPLDVLGHLGPEVEGVVFGQDVIQQAGDFGTFLLHDQIIQSLPDGVVLLNSENRVLWGNARICQWAGREQVAGENFYSLLGSPEILGPDFCPFHSALATGQASSSTLRSETGRYYQLHAVPVHEPQGGWRHLIVTVRDVTAEMLQQQKLAAIHQAGIELANLTPDELLGMSVDERVELLKSNILHFTKDLLNFDVVEIRLLDQKTGRLEPLLAEGMEPEAVERVLFAQPQNNGVTGFVAATGKSYLCEDTQEDPLYLPGARGARSSLTVPLLLHDEVIGTFNVESPRPGAFTESDLQFLEIFARDVAVALNTFELLQAERAGTAAASVEAIHSAVALPVDEILNDAVHVMERYIGHEPEVVQRLQRILRNARDIKQVIQKVGQKLAPAEALPHPPEVSRPALRGRRMLLVDEDASVREAAHALLERAGCIVETAPSGSLALMMARTSDYDVVIADIRLPDFSGYEFMLELQKVMPVEPLPLILMTGFGYDPGHSIVKARQAGLKAVLYKPFRLDQLLSTVEEVVTSTPRPVRQA